jgi:O-antigen/teichoic acid export membrane protein
VLVSLIAGGTQLGIFSYSYRVVEVMIGLPAIVVGAAYPILTRAARDDPDRFAYTVSRMFELAVIVAAWLAICLELGSGFVVEVIGGHAAAPAGDVLRIQGLAVIGTFVAAALAFPLLALRGYRATMYANASGLLATVALGLALIPSLGARGGALATVGGELALVIANAVALPRARPGLRLPLGAVPVAAIAGGAGIAIGHVVGIHAVVQVAAGTVVYGVVLALLGRFPPELSHALRPGRVTPPPPPPTPPA